VCELKVEYSGSSQTEAWTKSFNGNAMTLPISWQETARMLPAVDDNDGGFLTLVLRRADGPVDTTRIDLGVVGSADRRVAFLDVMDAMFKCL
jgi:hypothetical protein